MTIIKELVDLEMEAYYDGDYIDSGVAKYRILSLSNNAIKICLDILTENGHDDAVTLLKTRLYP